MGRRKNILDAELNGVALKDPRGGDGIVIPLCIKAPGTVHHEQLVWAYIPPSRTGQLRRQLEKIDDLFLAGKIMDEDPDEAGAA